MEADYDVAGGMPFIELREAFLFYFHKRFVFHGDQFRKSPLYQEIVQLNRAKVMGACFGWLEP
jgi:hypothetical protein